MARQSKRKQIKKPRPRKKGGDAQKAGCDNIGCIRIAAGGVVDVPVEGTAIFYCPDEEVGHPENVWRVINTTNENGFLVIEKEGYTGGSGVEEIVTVEAKHYYYECSEKTYLDANEPLNVMKFQIYKYCRDRKCR